jgi:hypothetical protein
LFPGEGRGPDQEKKAFLLGHALSSATPTQTESATNMTYKSTFQDRAAQAAEAKQKALEKLQSRPQLDEKTAAERIAAGEEKAAARAQKAAAKKAELKAGKEALAAEAAAKAAAAAPKSEAELKAARDARYAKRKARR